MKAEAAGAKGILHTPLHGVTLPHPRPLSSPHLLSVLVFIVSKGTRWRQMTSGFHGNHSTIRRNKQSHRERLGRTERWRCVRVAGAPHTWESSPPAWPLQVSRNTAEGSLMHARARERDCNKPARQETERSPDLFPDSSLLPSPNHVNWQIFLFSGIFYQVFFDPAQLGG